MRRALPNDLIIATLLVILGISLRMAFIHIPNFAPVAAIALLGGYALSSRALAVMVPLSVMVISDLLVGGYEPTIMLSVYLMLAAPALLGAPLRRVAQIKSLRKLHTWKSFGTLTGCALFSSCLFFAVTNLACWRFSGWYEQTTAGLTTCFAAALPFFRFTLAGDFAFTVAFFLAYAAAQSLAQVTGREPAVA